MARAKTIYLVYAKLPDDQEKLVGTYTVRYQSEEGTMQTYRMGGYNHLEHVGFTRYRVPDGNFNVGKIFEKTPCPWIAHPVLDELVRPELGDT